MLAYLKNNKSLLITIGVALMAFLLGFLVRNVSDTAGGNLSGAAGSVQNQVGCDTSSLSNVNPTGIVLADPLNMRIGPGLDYDVVTMLDMCTSIILVGRTGDYAWLEILLPGNVGGWVFAGYIQANVNIGDLDITTGYGGPYTDISPGGDLNVSVVIQANQAAAFVNGMPGNEEIIAVLRPSDNSDLNLVVTSGTTDAQGNVTLTFTMPTKWSDGSAVESGQMTLTLTAGGETVTAWLTYYTN